MCFKRVFSKNLCLWENVQLCRQFSQDFPIKVQFFCYFYLHKKVTKITWIWGEKNVWQKSILQARYKRYIYLYFFGFKRMKKYGFSWNGIKDAYQTNMKVHCFQFLLRFKKWEWKCHDQQKKFDLNGEFL